MKVKTSNMRLQRDAARRRAPEACRSARKIMMNDFLHEPIIAKDSDGLAVVYSLLHDEAFELSDILFNQEDHTITMPVRRQFHSGPERCIGEGILYKKYEKEWMHSVVIIHGVHALNIHHDQGIGSYTFCSWTYSDGNITIECNEALILKLIVDRLEIQVTDIGFSGKAQIERGPGGIEISSNNVYD